jgi:predicted GIY-YIG superfamily endonuclease
MVGLHPALPGRDLLHGDRQGRAGAPEEAPGEGAAYTRTRLPVELLYEENGLPRSEALVREARIKAMPRVKKGRLARKKV